MSIFGLSSHLSIVRAAVAFGTDIAASEKSSSPVQPAVTTTLELVLTLEINHKVKETPTISLGNEKRKPV